MTRNCVRRVLNVIKTTAFAKLSAFMAMLAAVVTIRQFAESRTHYDLAGEWRVTNRVESTSFRPYTGIRLGYRVFLRQHGVEIHGTGEKWTENGVRLGSSEHATLDLIGRIEGNLVIVTFTEANSKRRSTGTYRWRVLDGGRVLSGAFTSTAANSRGTSTARRVP